MVSNGMSCNVETVCQAVWGLVLSWNNNGEDRLTSRVCFFDKIFHCSKFFTIDAVILKVIVNYTMKWLPNKYQNFYMGELHFRALFQYLTWVQFIVFFHPFLSQNSVLKSIYFCIHQSKTSFNECSCMLISLFGVKKSNIEGKLTSNHDANYLVV